MTLRPPLVPELYVTNLQRSLEFYLDGLGFRVEYQRPEAKFAAISLEDAHLMLEETPSLQAASEDEFTRGEWRTAVLAYPFGRGLSLEITIADVDLLVTRLRARQVPLKLAPYEKWYRVDDRERGLRQFLVLDPDGYLLRFAQVLGERPI